MGNRNYYTITLALLGAVKLVLNSFSVDILTNTQMNDIANGVAAILTVAGVIMTHLKKKEVA